MADLTFGGTSGGAAQMVSTPPVLGNLDFPYSNAIIPSGSILTTGDLAQDDGGDWTGTIASTVEFLVYIHPLGTVPTSASFVVGPKASGTVARQWGIQFDPSGRMQFWAVKNIGPTQIFANPAGPTLTTGQWYYVAGVLLADTLYTAVDGVLSAGVSFGGASVQAKDAAAGTADMKAIGCGSSDIYIDEWAVYNTSGLSAARIQAHYDAARNRGFLQKSSGNRIFDVLDTVSSHAPRSIQTGARTVLPRYMSGQSPLEEIRLAVEADDVDAGFFAAADGTLTFLQDGHRSSAPYNADKCIFGDAGGSELPYVNIETDYSLTDVVNSWSGIRTAYGAQVNLVPQTQTVSDATSISATGGARPQVLGDIPTTSDAQVLAIVTGLLAKYKNPLYRITAIEPNLFDPATAAMVMTLELMDRVRVRWTPPGGGSRIDQVVYIQQIQRSGKPGENYARLVVSPL